MVLWGLYVHEQQRAHQAVVLVLKCIRRLGHGLNSHRTDLEKPEPSLRPLVYKTQVYPLHHGGGCLEPR